MATIRDLIDSKTIEKVIYVFRNKRWYLDKNRKSEIEKLDISFKGTRTIEEIHPKFFGDEERVGYVPYQFTYSVRFKHPESDVQHKKIGDEIGDGDDKET